MMQTAESKKKIVPLKVYVDSLDVVKDRQAECRKRTGEEPTQPEVMEQALKIATEAGWSASIDPYADITGEKRDRLDAFADLLRSEKDGYVMVKVPRSYVHVVKSLAELTVSESESARPKSKR